MHFRVKLFLDNHCQYERAGGTSQTACQNRPLATHTLIKPTSPLSQPASSFLMQSHVNCHSYLPSLSHSSLFSWSDYSLHFQLMLQPRQRGRKNMEGKLIFRLSLKCGLIINEVNRSWRHGRMPEMLRSTALDEHIWSPSKCPGGIATRSSTPRLRQKRRGEREHLRKQEEKERERVGWQGLICSVEQLFVAELPVLSALKDTLSYIYNGSQTFRILTKCLFISPLRKR